MASEAADDDNNHDDKWRDIAIERFGQDIVNATIHLYCGSYREMVQDDNVRGAVPTLTLGSGEGGALPCPWRRNSPTYFFLCLLVRLQFHREANELRLYLDARGERDLRNPKDSSIECMTDATDGALNSPLAEPTLISGEFVPEISMPGHHKGYLSFDAGQFSKAGKYYFTFADFRRNDFFLKLKATFEARGAPRNAMLAWKDYESVLLLQVPEEGGLERAFADVEGKICYALPSSPFEGETEEDEKGRFSPYTEDSLLERHETEGGGCKWWVSPNDQVSSEPQRALLFGAGPGGIESVHLLREMDNEPAEVPVALDPNNYLAGSGHNEDNEDTNVTAAEEAVARSSKGPRNSPGGIESVHLLREMDNEPAEVPVALDPNNYLAGSGHNEDNEDTNVTAAEEAVARSSKGQRNSPSKYGD